jgi:ABC-2 type transport system ATP-binding protein
MSTNRIAIWVDGLRKSYGQVVAVDGISFQVEAGEIFGMVGPNGSGKTTTIECIEGLRQPNEGQIKLLGMDPVANLYELRERTGIQLQAASLPRRMRVGEALDLFASFYRRSQDWHPMLERLGLADKERVYFSQLSGGQQQRLFVALALINQPEVVFLDELTTGLDPRARHQIWEMVREIREKGTTIFLTTHYMDEAESLCDRVGILDRGHLIALDTPPQLVQRLGMATRITFQVDLAVKNNGDGKGFFDPRMVGVLEGVQRVENDGSQVTVYGQGEKLIGEVVNSLEEGGIAFHDLRTTQANLEDVFLSLTGHEIEN